VAQIATMKPLAESIGAYAIRIRPASKPDLADIIRIDEEVSGLSKRNYWKDVFAQMRGRSQSPRFLLVAEDQNQIQGFILGEIRSWEFGEPVCGWVLAIQVRPKTRLEGIGTRLFSAICEAFRNAGISSVRTIMARDNHLVLSFFRSQGMMAGPFIELEMSLDEGI
jgi:ribosomal protein S18 acetylase RimI-like enzyme